MTARDTMASALRSTGLYTLNGKTLVDQELLAYCAALDTLYERLEVCKQDSFIGTASETGLLRWEALFGLKAHGSLEERREVLLQCGAVQNTSNTRSAFLAVPIHRGGSHDSRGPSGTRALFFLHWIG